MCITDRPDGPAAFLWARPDGTYECAVCHAPVTVTPTHP